LGLGFGATTLAIVATAARNDTDAAIMMKLQ
jgi:hypothetical protein